MHINIKLLAVCLLATTSAYAVDTQSTTHPQDVTSDATTEPNELDLLIESVKMEPIDEAYSVTLDHNLKIDFITDGVITKSISTPIDAGIPFRFNDILETSYVESTGDDGEHYEKVRHGLKLEVYYYEDGTIAYDIDMNTLLSTEQHDSGVETPSVKSFTSSGAFLSKPAGTILTSMYKRASTARTLLGDKETLGKLEIKYSLTPR